MKSLVVLLFAVQILFASSSRADEFACSHFTFELPEVSLGDILVVRKLSEPLDSGADYIVSVYSSGLQVEYRAKDNGGSDILRLNDNEEMTPELDLTILDSFPYGGAGSIVFTDRSALIAGKEYILSPFSPRSGYGKKCRAGKFPNG